MERIRQFGARRAGGLAVVAVVTAVSGLLVALAISIRPVAGTSVTVLAAAVDPTTTVATTTTTTATTTTSTSAPTEGPSVRVAPGDDLQALVEANPDGTAFLLTAGTYRRVSVTPRPGQTFEGERGPAGERLAVLDGEGDTQEAFVAAGVGDVTVRGLVITRYAAGGVFTAAINCRFPQPGAGWTIDDNEISYSGVGIYPWSHARVTSNLIHHNVRYGIGGQGDDILVAGNEIAYNRTDTDYNAGDSGATKFVYTEGLVLRDNWVHDNQGTGLWVDINNVDALIEGNLVEDNWWVGIFYEIGYAAVIRDNRVLRNGLEGYDDYMGAGINVTNSVGVEVTGNLLEGNGAGIVGRQWAHPADADDADPTLAPTRGARILSGFHVHDNDIRMDSGWTGVKASNFKEQVFGDPTNLFENNTYLLSDPDAKSFRWDGRSLNLVEWQERGQQ